MIVRDSGPVSATSPGRALLCRPNGNVAISCRRCAVSGKEAQASFIRNPLPVWHMKSQVPFLNPDLFRGPVLPFLFSLFGQSVHRDGEGQTYSTISSMASRMNQE